CWYACFVEANSALTHSGGVTVSPPVPMRAAVSSTLARFGALTACFTSSMLSSSLGSWAAVTSGCSGTELTELVAAGGEVATVDDPPGRMPTTVQITSTATATRGNTYDSVNPIRARSRPRSPVRRICDSPRWPSTAPTGANRNANTTDRVAKALIGRAGVGAQMIGGW